MKHFILLLIGCFLMTPIALAKPVPENQPAPDQVSASIQAASDILNLASASTLPVCRPQEIVERSGCCSHHGGVCGCASGRAMCCDGNLSPSCGCD